MHRHSFAATQLSTFHPIAMISIYVAYAPKCLINLATLTFFPFKKRLRGQANTQAAAFGLSRPTYLPYQLFGLMAYLSTPIKNHRYQKGMAMIFFILGMLVMARLCHTALV